MAGSSKVTVEYTGPSTHRRKITKQDFKKHDISVPADVVLDPANGHTMDVSNFPKEAVDLLEKQKNIKVSRVEESPTESPKPSSR